MGLEGKWFVLIVTEMYQFYQPLLTSPEDQVGGFWVGWGGRGLITNQLLYQLS
jgi:hypothetical protein